MPTVSLSPSSVDFEDTIVGSSSTATITVSNGLTESVALSLGGADSGKFTISPSTVAAGGVVTVTVTFTPSGQSDVVADYAATLSTSPASGSATLTGTGIDPQLVEGVSTIEFAQESDDDQTTGGTSASRKQFRIWVPDTDGSAALLMGVRAIDDSTDGFGLFTPASGMISAESGVTILAGNSAPVADSATGSGTSQSITTKMAIADASVAATFAARAVAFGIPWTSLKNHKMSIAAGAAAFMAGATGAGLSIAGAAGGNTPGGVNIYGDGGVLIASPMFSAWHSLLGLALTSLYPLVFGVIDSEMFGGNSATVSGIRKATVQSNRSTNLVSTGDVNLEAKGGGWLGVGSDKPGDINGDAGHGVHLHAKSEIHLKSPGPDATAVSGDATAQVNSSIEITPGTTEIDCTDLVSVATKRIHLQAIDENGGGDLEVSADIKATIHVADKYIVTFADSGIVIGFCQGEGRAADAAKPMVKITDTEVLVASAKEDFVRLKEGETVVSGGTSNAAAGMLQLKDDLAKLWAKDQSLALKGTGDLVLTAKAIKAKGTQVTVEGSVIKLG